ncbi:unnamed protein product [Linum trigynum]|uniref:Uncharacterized protein n=2 Tax=Linum trigynum TaxID=586398 RepID=A0AAV2GRS4_9ROSI
METMAFSTRSLCVGLATSPSPRVILSSTGPLIRRRCHIPMLGSGSPIICGMSISCSLNPGNDAKTLRTCKNCKTQFDPVLNHPSACRFHTAHYGGETKRKFESVHSGGTMSTPDAGRVFQYWHCCGAEDPFDPGCTASPHQSYDD